MALHEEALFLIPIAYWDERYLTRGGHICSEFVAKSDASLQLVIASVTREECGTRHLPTEFQAGRYGPVHGRDFLANYEAWQALIDEDLR